ncbi:MAG: membrane integrity-associated transporter subunit PqiC [Dokdonella sp.]|uniref:ABC-type transport auxiliary lipoprotein family protein n=1 Tax=Dokdonella sp. TaxID=2291710 RepID=UPI0025BF03C8|nr:ABC-type transport auxiliary lipoprotein family protein [Dokdonella sp.]MBX3700276.1 membrane integrity-associated transporter subunit PqiC [Dokdonella sp.]MCW5577035.1 membrane integrity-associated transporter subunit PqiC [Dokdonella sp.]
MKARLAAFVAVVALGACSAPTVPDFTWYRLPRPQPPPALTQPWAGSVVVEDFAADGLYADQALVYALDADAQQLRQYHYQMWADPPTRMLQRRLAVTLRGAGLARTVSDELPASRDAMRIRGNLLRMDRVPTSAGGWEVVVVLKLRAVAPGDRVLVDDIYRDGEPAGGSELKASVDAYGAAIDRIYARFLADLQQHHGDGDAR